MHERTVLVVDDERAVCELLSRVLGLCGYAVRTAGSAEQALERMRESPAQVLFLDNNLPGMSGAALCREVRRCWPWSISIAVTGDVSLFEFEKWKRNGFADLLPKPMSLKDLLTTAARAFEQSQNLAGSPSGPD